MQRINFSLLTILCLTGSLALAGCGGPMTFDASGTFPGTTTTVSQPIQFSNYGGHAPIVGAKVFLLQPSTSGYGTKVSSILTPAAGGTDTTYVGTGSSPAYYVTTDASGISSITGEYTCTAGLPVYLYALGGAPDNNPGVAPSNLISGSLASNGTYLTETFTVNNEKFYVGQQVTFSNIPAGNEFAANNGQTFTVSAISTTDNTSFTITTTNAYTNGPQGPFAMSGTVTPVGVQNPGIVNTAMLGICPSAQSTSGVTITGIPQGTSSYQLAGVSASDIAKLAVGEGIVGPGVGPGGNPTTITAINAAAGTLTMAALDTGGDGMNHTYTIYSNNFGPTSSIPISFIYMNEVSTAAMMFAMAPFAETATTSGGVVTRTGTDALHIGIPGSDSLALTGLQNAAVNAGQLYDITGSNVANGCTAFPGAPTGPCANGEAHIARSFVPNSGNGYGVATVPTSLVDTLGNILAACVDSANTYGTGASGSSTAGASSQCKTLFQTATSDGKPVTTWGSTTPSDTATAAINIAHYPAGNGANAGAFMSNLFGLQTGVVPFVPNLSTAPTDFVIGINITVPQGSNPTNYLGSSGTTPAAAKPTAIAAASTGEVFVGTTGCGNGSAETTTNGYGCVLQLEPYQLLPALPTVGGVGLAQGVKSISLGPSGKVWVTGTLETGQTVGGYTPPAGAFYVEETTPSAANPITYGTANGNLATSYNFASFGNVKVMVQGQYPNYYGTPTAIVVNGNGHAYIADSTKNDLHDVTGLATTSTTPAVTYATINNDSEYLIQGTSTAVNNCLANVSALAIGAATSAHGGAYNIWAASNAGTTSQGMCTIADPAVGGLAAADGNNPTVNTVTPVEQGGPQFTPTSLAIDANDTGWDANQSPGATYNQTGEGFPNNGVALYGTDYAYAQSATTTPSGVAIDGNNNLWYTNQGSNSVSVYTNPGIPVIPSLGSTAATRISPAGTAAGNSDGGYKASGTLSGPTGIAIDPSGDVWVINTGSTGVGYSVTELIGVAAPTYAPLAAAQAANKLGAKP